MAFNRIYQNGFPMRRPTLRELVKAIQANEQRGYECKAPYKKVYKAGKKYVDRPHLINGVTYASRKCFADSFDECYYEVWMDKKVN